MFGGAIRFSAPTRATSTSAGAEGVGQVDRQGGRHRVGVDPRARCPHGRPPGQIPSVHETSRQCAGRIGDHGRVHRYSCVGSVWLVRGGLQTGYPLYARFPWGSGIKQGQSVLPVGRGHRLRRDVDLRPRWDADHRRCGSTSTITCRRARPRRSSRTGFSATSTWRSDPVHPNAASIAEGDTVPIGRPAPTISDLLASVDTASGKLNDVAKTVQVELVQGGGIADLRLRRWNMPTSWSLQLSEIADRAVRSSSQLHALAQPRGECHRLRHRGLHAAESQDHQRQHGDAHP